MKTLLSLQKQLSYKLKKPLRAGCLLVLLLTAWPGHISVLLARYSSADLSLTHNQAKGKNDKFGNWKKDTKELFFLSTDTLSSKK